VKWQSHREILRQNRLCDRLAFGAQAMALIGVSFLALGWWNCQRILTSGLGARIPFFDLADEQISLINFLEPVAMIYAAVLCAGCARLDERSSSRRGFIFLSATFVGLAYLESDVGSHGIQIERMNYMLGVSNPRLSLLPFFVLPIGAALYLIPFLRRLPFRHAIRFLACGAIYVAGVLGVEMFSQVTAVEQGTQSQAYLITAGVEETLEVVGIVGFGLAVCSYLRELSPTLKRITS
jgi:hypothetical protein